MHAFLKRDTNCFMCVFWINFMSSYKIRCHLVDYTLLLSYFYKLHAKETYNIFAVAKKKTYLQFSLYLCVKRKVFLHSSGKFTKKISHF